MEIIFKGFANSLARFKSIFSILPLTDQFDMIVHIVHNNNLHNIQAIIIEDLFQFSLNSVLFFLDWDALYPHSIISRSISTQINLEFKLLMFEHDYLHQYHEHDECHYDQDVLSFMAMLNGIIYDVH